MTQNMIISFMLHYFLGGCHYSEWKKGKTVFINKVYIKENKADGQTMTPESHEETKTYIFDF